MYMFALVNPHETLSFLPYSTVEVVFNNFQLWGNLQNHHPACITYDLEDEWKWRPLLMEPADPVDSDVLLAPPIRDKKCQVLAEDLASSVLEHIRLHRMKKGLEVFFEHREELLFRLTFYLDLLEYRMHLDDLHNPGPGPNHMGWSSFQNESENAEMLQESDCQFYQTISRQTTLTSEEKAMPETQEAMHMHREYGGDAYCMFADVPPPGGFFDPFETPQDSPHPGALQEAQTANGWTMQLVPHQNPPQPELAMNPLEGFEQEIRYQDKMAKLERKAEDKLVDSYAQQKAGIGSWLPGKNNRMDPYSPAGLKFSAAQAHMALPPSSPRSASLPTAYATAAQPPRASAGTSVSCASSISSGAGAAPPRKTVTFAEGVPPETSKRPPVRRQALLLRRLSARLQAAIVEGEALMRSEEAALRAALSAEKRPEGEPARKPERERTTLRRPLETSASAAPAAPCQEGGENEAQRMFARLRTLRPATEKRESSASPPQGLQAASAASRPPASQAPSSASPAAQRGAAAGGRELLSDAPSSSAPPRDAPARASAACGSTAAPERETPFSVNASAVTFLALLRRMSTAMRQLESDLLRRACDGDAARGESAGDDGEGGRVEERRRRGSPSAEEKPGRRLSGGARGRREAARGAETRKGSETTSRGKREMRLNDSRPSHESAHDACLSREKREQEACEKKTGVEQRLRYKEEMRRKVHARLEALAVERSQREAEEAKREAHSLLQEAEEEGRKRALGEPRDDGRPFLQQALVSAELWPAPQSSAPEADLEGRVASAETGEERHATDGEKRGEGELEGEVEDAKDSEKNGNGEEGESDSYSSQSQVSEAYVSLWSGSDSGSDGWASPVPEPEAPEEEDEEMLAGDPFFFSSRSREGRAANQGAPRGSEGAGDAGSRLRQRRQPHARDEGAARPHAGGEESTGSPTHASSSSATFRCVTGRAWLSNLLRKPKNQKEEGSRGTQESRAAAVPALSEQPGARSPPGATSHRSERGERVAQDGDERRQEAGEKAPQRARPDVAGRGDFSAISVPCESAGGRASSPPSSSVSPASSDLSSDTDTLGGSLPPSDVELNQFEAPRGQHYVWDESDESDSEREDAPTEERAAPDGDSKQDARELRRRGARSEPWQIFVPPAACADTPREQLRQARERRKQRRAEKRRENLRAEEAKRAQELEALLLAERQETAEDAQAQPKGGAETEPCESAKEPAKGAEGENGSGKRHSPSTVLADIQKMIASSSQRRTSRAPSSAAAAPSPGVTAQPATAAFLAEDRAAYSRSSSSGAKASEDTGLGNDAHASGSSQARLPLAAPASASARMREIYRQCRQKASRSQCFSSSSASLLSMPSLPSLSASSLAVKKMTGVFLQAQKRKARRSGQEACVTNSDADDSWGVAEVSEGVEEEAGRRAGNKGLEFYEAAEHSMMYDLDYDDMPKQNFGGATAWGYNQTAAPPPPTTAEMNMKAPEGMRWDPFSQTYQYTYRNPYVDEAYGDPYAGAVQQQGEVAQVELNAGRLADYRIGKGAYRVNQQTGAHDLIDGPQKDLYGKYGAMDHIDQKKDKRPKGPRPTEWDLQYAKNLYEQGVPAGYTPAPNEEDQEALVRDLLRAPTQGAEEYAAYDGGVDIAALGLATERPADKKVRVAKPQAADAEDEEERLEQPASPPAAEPRAGAGAYAKKTEEEPVVPPIEWHRPSPTGHYAADQVAKWKWYYRMEEIYYIWQQMDFPVRNNHVFCGFPVHFSSSDVNDIRSYLGGARRFRKLLDIPVDSIVYAITAKCFPLMGGVISTWLFFGAEVPLIVSDSRKTSYFFLREGVFPSLRVRPFFIILCLNLRRRRCPVAFCLQEDHSTQERERRMKRTKKPKHVKRPED
ncbi:Sma protein [Besnoitia besnoiti]|uniref:Sma protein n=1 Tax=Besnoitia besnoiti TaxID=94643 RepID=A0A2A9M6K9_BESBE|nr:Sma protein [Besnoitia besnoiti]PFH33589.1 Sma protein [Besnoitia besnoiti]